MTSSLLWGLIVMGAILAGIVGPPIYYRLRYGNTKMPLKEEDQDD
jgi:hypothetical protein